MRWLEEKNKTIEQRSPMVRAPNDQLAVGTGDWKDRQDPEILLGIDLLPIDEKGAFYGRPNLHNLFNRAARSACTKSSTKTKSDLPVTHNLAHRGHAKRAQVPEDRDGFQEIRLSGTVLAENEIQEARKLEASTPEVPKSRGR